ncbi:MAG: hypothetical protein LUO91_07025 [Methanomicrobiales archaeon]|nr:hypothetical protein [Methanomicrobiales archaeon]
MIYGVAVAVLLLVIPAAVIAVPTDVKVFLHSNNVELERNILGPYYIDVYQSGTNVWLGRFHSGMTIMVNDPTDIYYIAYTGPNIKGPQSASITIGDGVTELTVAYATMDVNLHNGGDPLGSPTYYLQIQAPIGKKVNGDEIYVPVDSTFTYKACTLNTCGTLETGTGGFWALDYEFTKVTVNLYNGNTVLDLPDYFLTIVDMGKMGTGQFFFAPEGSVLSFKASTVTPFGSVIGPQTPATIGPAPDQTLDYQYATVEVHLYDEAGDLSLPYALAVTNMGKFVNGDKFHVPPGAVISYQAVANTLIGTLQSKSFGPGDTTLDVEYATVEVQLYGDTDELWTETIWFLEIPALNEFPGHQQTFTVPAGAEFWYRARTNSISGPLIKTSFGRGRSILRYDYAKVTFLFDFVGGRCPMQTQVTGIAGTIANGKWVYVPTETDISFRADVCGGLSGMQTDQFDAGAGTVTWSMTFNYA